MGHGWRRRWLDGHHGGQHIVGGVHDVGSQAASSGYARRRVAIKVSAAAASSVSESSRDGLNPISSMMTSSSHLSL